VEYHSVSNLSAAWLAGARSLLERSTTAASRETWDLAVEVSDPGDTEWSDVRSGLDAQLSRQALQSIDTVANTIFPLSLRQVSRDRTEFFARYRRLVPRLKRFRGNHHGLYFDRLTEWPPGAAEPLNQVEMVITRIISERKRPGPLRFIYDMSLFSPSHDPRPIGFPCLAYLNVKLDGGRLRLTAHYRNHYFVERAYGNYLGLARLQAFIAAEVGLTTGPLTCVSGHAELEPAHADRYFVQWLRDIIGEHPTCV
jgi:thymidylate synthase